MFKSSCFRFAVLSLGFLLAISLSGISDASAKKEDGKVRICHATHAFSNPYRPIIVSKKAVDGGGKNDHTHHTGPVFDSALMNQGDVWGDIIPAFGENVGFNWNDEGRAIWENDCRVPQEEKEDVCRNIEGVQNSVPDEYELTEGTCVPRQEEDICENIEGVQTKIPKGYSLSEGVCSLNNAGGVNLGPSVTPQILGTSTISSPRVLPQTGSETATIYSILAFLVFLTLLAGINLVFEKIRR